LEHIEQIVSYSLAKQSVATMVNYLEEFAASKVGVVLPATLNWSIFITFSSGSANFSSNRRTELNSSHLIPKYTSPIRFGTIMDDYRKVSATFMGRGRAPG
jgi:IS1 family transposase